MMFLLFNSLLVLRLLKPLKTLWIVIAESKYRANFFSITFVLGKIGTTGTSVGSLRVVESFFSLRSFLLVGGFSESLVGILGAVGVGVLTLSLLLGMGDFDRREARELLFQSIMPFRRAISNNNSSF